MTLSRKRLLVPVFVLLGILPLGGAIYVRLATVRQIEAVVRLNNLAADAIARARDAGAMRWAETEFGVADRAYQAAYGSQLVEQRHRFWVPNLTAARAGFARAKEAADRAVVVASAAVDGTRIVAKIETELAEDLLALDEWLTSGVQLDVQKRLRLSQARSLLEEARIRSAAGDYLAARSSASSARSLALEVSEDAAALVARYSDPATVERWVRLKQTAIEKSRRDGSTAIVVSKQARTLTLYVAGRVERTYPVEFGFNWIADKLVAGDGATPEGQYRVTVRKGRGETLYHKALLIDYPNAQASGRISSEAWQASRDGVP